MSEKGKYITGFTSIESKVLQCKCLTAACQTKSVQKMILFIFLVAPQINYASIKLHCK